MVEESEAQKLKSKYPEFFAQFSPDFLEFVFSKELSLEIATICLGNNIEDDETIDKITYQITLVLFNQTPKESLVKIFEKEAGLNLVIAEKISFELDESIFSQVPGSQPTKSSPLTKKKIILSPEPEPPPEAEAGKIKKDTYRETTE